ncbi:hypothetical protein M407DRAFT_28733 [Tulasnella calospora MUT 4182]|uniref:F-box domain-containing protein n=1 Tax=Tulasnella calospora MUT 4182 TaxID=1051891 RepID=A0A0C3QA52_9AGAM|nr:hypothetical protein M407DRAFT_28733 [Tulasnella calospora MUT 4182]
MDTIPTEILLHILGFSIPYKRQRRVRKSLSRVCHFWRTAIYGNPLFWTEVRLHRSIEELQGLLRRNPDGPLDIVWAPSNSSKFINNAGMRKVAMISPQSHRWRSLVLAGMISHEMAAQLIDVPTPRLINLNIVGFYYGHGKLAFSRAGAALRELTLGRIALDIDWEGPRLTGLRYLRVHGPTGGEPTVEELHAILSSSPGLEILDLSYWSFMVYYEPHVKELGPVLLPSLTTLAVKEVPPRFLRMLLSCVQAPNCRYIRLPTISHVLFQDNHPLGELGKLCQGPLSTIPRLLICYDRATETCTITHRGTDFEPQPDTRESPVKLAKRRGIYLRTERIPDPSGHDIPQLNQARVRIFIQEFIQPALRNLKIEIQLELRNIWPQVTSPSPKSVVAELLLHVPQVKHLRICSHFDPMEVIPFLSVCQPIQTGAKLELCWLVPLMETLTVACDPKNQSAVLESLNNMISKRGSHVHRGVTTASRQANERGEGTFQPPRALKHIVVQYRNEVPTQMQWDSTQGWRTC